MDVAEFIRTNKSINVSEIARLMWPGNKSAKTYLSRKLSSKGVFTDKDAVRARQVLHDLGITLINLTT